MTFGEETKTPDFLPQKPHSWEQLRVAVRGNLDATLRLIPPLPAADLAIPSLETTVPGTYALSERPTIGLMRALPSFKNGDAEVGLFCVNGKWLISLNKGMETTLPNTLTAIQHDGIFQADIHSHPGDDAGAEQPSREDISKLSSTIDGRNYIISNKGLIEFQRPQNLPGGSSELYDSERAWRNWITEELKLTEDEFNQRGGWELKKEFYAKFFGLRTISWENEEEIENILSAKEQLKVTNP
jgi:hypothetical protein